MDVHETFSTHMQARLAGTVGDIDALNVGMTTQISIEIALLNTDFTGFPSFDALASGTFGSPGHKMGHEIALL